MGPTNSSGSSPAPTATASLGALWSSLQQPEPFKAIGQTAEAAAERRLSMADAPAKKVHLKSISERLEAAGARMVSFLESFGVDNNTVAEDLKDWGEDQFEEIAPLIQEFWEVFTGAHDEDPA